MAFEKGRGLEVFGVMCLAINPFMDMIQFVLFFYRIRLGNGRGHETLYICLLWLCLIRLDGNTLIPSRVGKEMASRKIPLSLFWHW